MSFPKTVTRQTGHAKPKCQVYQPGFNPDNSCWLGGRWLTVPSEGWEARKAAHEALYGNLRAETDKQHHRNPATPLEALTPAQRQAFEFYSGERHLDCRHVSGRIGPVSVSMAGERIDTRSIRWLRQEGYRVFRRVKQHDQVIDQTTIGVPEGLFDPEEGVVNTWEHVVRQNREREKATFEGMLGMIGTPQDMMAHFGDAPPVSFARAMAFQSLVQAAEDIIRDEHYEQTHGQQRGFTTLDELRQTYAEKHKALKAKLGDEEFEASRGRAWAGHNECARANLDNSKGHLYCYVLPKFNEDGTHEPWGERDVPWNAK